MIKLEKYEWLINTFRYYRYGLTFEQFQSEWRDGNPYLDETLELNRRSFIRWKNEVKEKFGIVIGCDVKNGYKYKIYSVIPDWKVTEPRAFGEKIRATAMRVVERYGGGNKEYLADIDEEY